jgi:hypothetical protein
MANTVNYVSYTHAPSGSETFERRYTITFSGSYTAGASNGETCNLITAANLNGLEGNADLPVVSGDTGYPDVLVANFQGYQVLLGPLSAGSFQVRFFVMSSVSTELASGAYPTAVSGGVLIVAVRKRS